MDKFVVRQKKCCSSSGAGSSSTTSLLKQSKLHQLAGVVVYEEINAARVQLENSETSAEGKVSILVRLGEKKPSKEILRSTGIGKAVRKLCDDSDGQVSSAAAELYNKWKAHVIHVVSRRPVQVESDLKTRKARTGAVKLIVAGCDDFQLAECIEKEILKKCRNILSCTYTRLTRKAHFALKNDESLRARIERKDINAAQFVKDLNDNLIKIYSDKPNNDNL